MPRAAQRNEAPRTETQDHPAEEQPEVTPSRQPDHKIQMGRVQGSVWSKGVGDGRVVWSV
jgi:hypothetical protein